MKHIVICADDYGQNPAVGSAIRHLAETQRISATSCLVTSPYWPQEAQHLKKLDGQIDIGLHLNLTEGIPLSKSMSKRYPSLKKLMIQSACGLINRTHIEHEFNQQLDRFVSHFHRLPDYIDGHQHVIQFPVIRDALLNVYNQHLSREKTYIRSTVSPNPTSLKAKIINNTGAKKFHAALHAKKIPCNTALLGNYNFKKAAHYGTFFKEFLEQAQPDSVILCHPGQGTDQSYNDPISHVRTHEYNYLSSQKFLDHCHEAGVKVGRLEIARLSTPTK